MKQLATYSQTNVTDIDVCAIKNDELYNLMVNDFDQLVNFVATETILPKRIPDKDFTELINLLRFFVTKVPLKDIENAFVSKSREISISFQLLIVHVFLIYFSGVCIWF